MGEVTCLGGVTRLSILSLVLSLSRLRDRLGDPSWPCLLCEASHVSRLGNPLSPRGGGAIMLQKIKFKR